MKLVVFNGSPRRTKSNSTILFSKFKEGFTRFSESGITQEYIAGNKNLKELVNRFNDADHVIIIFPLYTDCMPGIVKEFLEEIDIAGINTSIHLGFIVQSGFPESIHSEAVEAYLQKFTTRIGCKYSGTAIRGGVEGIQVKNERMNKKLFSMFEELGSYYAQNNGFSKEILLKLRKPRKFNIAILCILRLINLTGALSNCLNFIFLFG